MQSREKIIKTARKYIGYIEKNNNDTVYGEWFGLNFQPWCGIFISFVFYESGFRLPKIGFDKGFASCQLAVDYFRQNIQITDKPRVGDLVFFDFNEDRHYDHCGIIVAATETMIITIEGNTSAANNRNGGSVMIRLRDKRDSNIYVNVIDANELDRD